MLLIIPHLASLPLLGRMMDRPGLCNDFRLGRWTISLASVRSPVCPALSFQLGGCVG